MKKIWFETHRNFGFGEGETKKFKTSEAAVKYAKKVGGIVRITHVIMELVARTYEHRTIKDGKDV